MNRKMFDLWVETQLAPTLEAGDVVILDNLVAHKREKANARRRQHPQPLHPRRMPKLPRRRRLCDRLKAQCSSRLLKKSVARLDRARFILLAWAGGFGCAGRTSGRGGCSVMWIWRRGGASGSSVAPDPGDRQYGPSGSERGFCGALSAAAEPPVDPAGAAASGDAAASFLRHPLRATADGV